MNFGQNLFRAELRVNFIMDWVYSKVGKKERLLSASVEVASPLGSTIC